MHICRQRTQETSCLIPLPWSRTRVDGAGGVEQVTSRSQQRRRRIDESPLLLRRLRPHLSIERSWIPVTIQEWTQVGVHTRLSCPDCLQLPGGHSTSMHLLLLNAVAALRQSNPSPAKTLPQMLQRVTWASSQRGARWMRRGRMPRAVQGPSSRMESKLPGGKPLQAGQGWLNVKFQNGSVRPSQNGSVRPSQNTGRWRSSSLKRDL